MEAIRDRQCGRCVSMLANLTRTEEGAKALLQQGNARLEGLHLTRLVHLMIGSTDEEHDHVANVLMNVTRVPLGRQLLAAKGSGLLPALAEQLTARSEERRIGIARALQHCCASLEGEEEMSDFLEEAGKASLRAILKPVSGIPPKERSDDVRAAAAGAVAALAASSAGRDALWDVDAPNLLKKGYEDEEHVETCDAMERAANLFISNSAVDDEDGNAEGGGEEEEVVVNTGGRAHIGPGGMLTF